MSLPKPASVRIAAGNAGHRPIPEPLAIIEGAAGLPPEPPESLGEAGKAVWVRIWPTLRAWAVADLDIGLVMRYCQAHELRETLRDRVKGVQTRGSRGQMRLNPIIIEIGRLEDRMLRMEHELGLSPAGRSALRIETKKPAPIRKLDKYISEPS